MSGWDTSALLKLYVAESDSPVFEQIASSSARIVTVAIARYEMEAAFRRKETEGGLAPGDAGLFQSQFAADIEAGIVECLEFSREIDLAFSVTIAKCMAQTPPVFIRTNDALHLAAALVAGESEFVTADARQRVAATLAGLTVRP